MFLAGTAASLTLAMTMSATQTYQAVQVDLEEVKQEKIERWEQATAPRWETQLLQWEKAEAEAERQKQREEQERKRKEQELAATSTTSEEATTSPAESPAPSLYDKWYPIAKCESGYGGEPNWSINTGNGYYGGVQFDKSSWDWAVEVGGHSVPAYPHQATAAQQIAVAETLLAIHPAGWGAWPACSRKVGYR